MEVDIDLKRLIDSAPRVDCPRCEVEMTLRNLLPRRKPYRRKQKSYFRQAISTQAKKLFPRQSVTV
jgi:hypothetical protein